MTNAVITSGCLIKLWVSCVNTINPRVRALKNDSCVNFSCPQCGCCISSEERVAGSTSKDDNSALFKMSLGATTNIWLGNLWHLNCAHDARMLTSTLESILQCKTVHHSCQHSHVVSLGLVHTLTSTFETAPEVSASDNDGNIST